MKTKKTAQTDAPGETSEASSASHKENEWIAVSPRLLIGLIGAVACYAWLFITLGTSTFFPMPVYSGLNIEVGHIAFLCGALVALIVCWLLSHVFSKYRLIQFFIAAALALSASISLWLFQGNFTVACAGGAAMGLAFGFLYPLYGEYICKFFTGRIRQYVHGLFLCAGIACCGFLFTGGAGGETAFFFSCFIMLVAFVAYIVEFIKCNIELFPVVDNTQSDKNTRIVWRSYIATATSSMTAGFALGCLLSFESVAVLQPWEYVIAAACVCITCIFLLVDSFKWGRVVEAVIMRFSLPVSAILVFTMVFVPPHARLILLILLLCWSILPTTCSIAAVCKHIAICELSPIRIFSLGRWMSFLGLIVGFVLAFAAQITQGEMLLDNRMATTMIIIFMLLIILSASFVMTEDNYPNQARFHVVEGEDEPQIEVMPPIPIHKFMQTQVFDEMINKDLSKKGAFRAKCDAVSEKYGLSNRQREVLFLLAKGRNADYITEKLVISPHTAKAHIYNIYQKTGVHSRQELMDLVEKSEVNS